MTAHPYSGLPATAFWRKAVAGVGTGEVDPVIVAPFTLALSDRVATAGSCFAQHIARHLSRAGFDFMVTEPAHPLLSPALAEAYGYGLYTARYGNIYTARQLVQLFQRAYGTFEPEEPFWREASGSWTDPFRPAVQPERYVSRMELDADRAQHLACVRRAFEELDVFVFTLGLTESWVSRADGAVYPLCPGTNGGCFDPAKYAFHNATAAEVTADLAVFVDALRGVNPAARVVLTVSPVPLVATASGEHVLAATAYSKAVLRVAAGEVSRMRAGVAYFPSFEIITGHFNHGHYFAADMRSVTEEGVNHVMRVFLRHFTEGGTQPHAPAAAGGKDAHTEEMRALVRVVCEEEVLGQA